MTDDANMNIYQEILSENRNRLSLPNECDFTTKATWGPLVWFYSQQYFTQVWFMQEINVNESWAVHCGLQIVKWEWIELVAGYIILEPTFSSKFGFMATHCWWAATLTTECIWKPRNWLFILYLVSNFSSSDPRDIMYIQSLVNWSIQTQ